MEIFNTALYCRLSREDENVPQSESIKNQIDFLTRYAIDQGWQIFDVYIDDGYSGTNFDRPGFQRLLADIQAGKVNLVITKDLSRLGRDYIETGRFLERYFPENNIRYIAITDGIDTAVENGNSDMAPFKSVINDMYAKDISKKVRSVFRSKAALGKYIGSFAPYGYRKDSADHGRLVVDQVAASIVRRIFSMYIEGHGLTNIAHILNEEKVPSPTAYKSSDSNYKNGRMKICLWSHSTIKSILKNPTYCGNLSQGKYKRVNYKSKKLLKVRETDWVIISGTHEPIVSHEDFLLVQNIFHRRGSENVLCKKSTKLLSGFVFCSDCGEHLTFHKTPTRHEYVICSTYKRYTSAYCSRHSLKVDELENAVLTDIQELLASVIRQDDIIAAIQSKQGSSQKNPIAKELGQLEKKLAEINNTVKSLYMDKVKGILTDDDFIELNKSFAQEKDTIIYRYNELQKISDREAQKSDGLNRVLAIANSVTNPQILTRELLEVLVEKIEIAEDGSIKITYKFRDPRANDPIKCS